MKIAIIGYSGAGKSTLTKKLSEKLKIPRLYLDTVNFKENWEERSTEEAIEIVGEFMKNESWIIDGTYSKFLQKERFDMADKIIFLDLPRLFCFKEAYKRYRQNKNSSRESIATGCNEKFDLEFVKWLLIDGRTKRRRKKFAKICKEYGEKIVVLKNRAEVLEYVNNFQFSIKKGGEYIIC